MNRIAFLCVLTALTGPALADEYFVSPQGANTNPGTYKKPWRTLYHALGKLKSLDDLYVRGGWYEENLNVYCFRGAPLKRIRVMAYQGEPVHIDSLSLKAPNYWGLEDLSIGKLKIIGGHGWDVVRCLVGKLEIQGKPTGYRIIPPD